MKITQAKRLLPVAMLCVLGSASVLAADTDPASTTVTNEADLVATTTEASDSTKAAPAAPATNFDSVIGSDVLPGLKLPVLMDPNATQDGC